MSRDSYLDAMLRHLGAAYYESLHGRASAADVARARKIIEERMAEQPGDTEAGDTGPGETGPADTEHGQGSEQGSEQGGKPRARAHHRGRWHSTVRDVMTTSVVTVDRITSFKEIARLLTENRISAVPVLVMGRRVAGVVSGADLLAVEDEAARRARTAKAGHMPWSRRPGAQHPALTAEELMSAPAITISPDTSIPRAAKIMHDHGVKRLPVVDHGGKLIGIVSRRDLLSVFVRPDALIAAEARELLAEVLFADPASVTLTVQNGVVILTGQPGSADHHDLIPVAVRLIWDIDGVVDVVDKISAADAPAPAAPAGG